MLIFSIAFVLLLSCSVVTPPNLVVVVGGVTTIKILFLPLFVIGNHKTKSIKISSEGTLGTRRCM
jgi:hypothetical protein